MMNKKFSFYIFFGLIFANSLIANNSPVPIGQWRVHFSYKNVLKAAETDDKIYCATSNGLFIYKISEGSVERLSKANGFYGYIVSDLKYDTKLDVLIIVYQDCTIEIVKNNKIIINEDIKRKTINGIKKINQINIVGEIAYLSCSFGLIEFNISKNEIRNSYLNIGPNGNTIPIYNSAVLKDSIYLSTDLGIIHTSTNSNINLSDFNNWIQTKSITKKSKFITAFNQNLYTEIDSQLFIYKNFAWSLYENYASLIISNIDVCHDKLLIGVYGKHIITEDLNGTKTYKPVNQLNQCLLDFDQNYWYSSPFNGMVVMRSIGEINYYPNGPNSNKNFAFSNVNNNLWVTPGGFPDDNYDQYYIFNNTNWNYPDRNIIADKLFNYRDIISSKTNGHTFIGTHGKGLLHLINGNPVKNYDYTNSPLKRIGNLYTTISGLALDKNNNLWVSNYGIDSSLLQFTNKGVWFNYKLPVTGNSKIIIDSKNNKWIMCPNTSNPIVVYNDKGTATLTDDIIYPLTTNKGSGNLPSSNITSIAFNKLGELIVGSDLGYSRIANPNNLFTGGNYDAQRITIGVEAGTNLGGYLLGPEYINCITIDGADRRWVGTNNGAWLIGDDGQTILLHFTKDNSPLMTDEIKSIGIMDETGEVFFGTNNGIISYQSDALLSKKNFNDVKIFPNPVRPDFDGDIAITGLMDNTLVKVTDINGQLVYQTYSNGGMATWNCKTLSGERPSTGVYLAFCINTDGTETGLGKILFIK